MVDVHRFTWPDQAELEHDILEAIAHAREKSPHSQLGVQSHGWNSAKTLQEWAGAAIGTFLEYALECFVEVTAEDGWRFLAWANIQVHGADIKRHDHSKCEWTMVHYIAPGPAPAPIRFWEECTPETPSGERAWVNTETITPERGLSLVFPGTAHHSVDKQLGEDRLSIAVNADRGGPELEGIKYTSPYLVKVLKHPRVGTQKRYV